MILSLVIYILVILVWVLSSKTSVEPWRLSPQTSWAKLCLSIVAGLVGGNTFVTFTGFAYKYGVGTQAYFIGVLAGLTIMHLFNSHIRSKPQENLGAGLVIGHYPKSTQFIFLGANVLRYLAVSLIQIIAGGLLLQEIIGIHYNICTMLIVVTIYLYTYRQGFSGVVTTDFFQMILILIPLVLITLYFLFNSSHEIGYTLLNESFEVFTISKSVLFGLFGFLLVIGSLDIWQRYSILKSDRHSLYSLLVSSLCIIITSIGIFLISIELKASHLQESINPDEIFVRVFKLSSIPRVMYIALFIGVLSAIMSTADTFIQGSALIVDKIRLGFGVKNKSYYSITLLLISAVLLFIANIYTSILSLAVFFANIVFAFAPFLFLLLIGKKPHFLYVNIGLVLSVVYALFVGLVPNVSIEYSYGTLLISCIFMFIGLIKSKSRNELGV